MDSHDYKLSQFSSHNFYVVRNLNMNVVLRRDLLQQNEVRIYFDLRTICLGDECVALKKDRDISSIARIARTVTLNPISCTRV